MASIASLKSDQLYHLCDPAQFDFDTTAGVPDLNEIVGQSRAASSIEFGIGMRREGYNVFVMGPTGAGKHTLVRQYLAARVAPEVKPSDWVYVNNFEHPHQPVAIELQARRGVKLRDDLQRLVDELRMAIPAAFESDEYRSRSEQIDAEFNERHERVFGELRAEAMKENVGLLRTPTGFSLAPLKNGEVIGAEDYAQLPEAEKERIETVINVLQQKLEKIIRAVLQWRKERFEKVKQLNREMTLLAVGHLVDDLRQGYLDLPKVLRYLDAVRQDVIENADDFRRAQEPPGGVPPFFAGPPSLGRYQVNVLVDHSSPDGSPLVIEEHPTYQNLVGRVDHISQFGTLTTDFSLIKPGALHRANGGYLLLDAYKLLTQPLAWEGLKRALSTGRIRIESLGEMYSLVSTVSLEPEPIPLDIKVILFGERRLYYLLHAYDPDFQKLFKVASDFDERIDRSAENDRLYARMIATAARRDGLLPFDRSAVARTIEHSARVAGDAKKLSGNLRQLCDLLGEADYWARSKQHQQVTADAVQHAIDAQVQRADRLRERVHETILRGTVMIDTDGARTGQVNALSVLELGDFAFAEPTRVTATTRLGEGQLIDVQREVELGGAIHSKGVLILSAFLAARYSTKRPHSLSASLVFEQTYGTVEGDSASLAELCALLSSLADLPIKQSLAVTGSVNQLGQVQAIGAVNEKIEGFFDICRARGLTGEQGVLIPAANVEHLMLRREVVAAVAAGRFGVFPIETVDQAIELLTGAPAGEPVVTGEMPEKTVNGRVAKRLRELSELRRVFAGVKASRRKRQMKAKDG